MGVHIRSPWNHPELGSVTTVYAVFDEEPHMMCHLHTESTHGFLFFLF